MSQELLKRIHMAQVEAGENAVVEDLRRKGLLPTKPHITVNLHDFDLLCAEFCDEMDQQEERVDLLRRLTLSQLIEWLRRKKGREDGAT